MRNESYKVHINQLIGKYCVRMVNMNQLISSVYTGSNATSINVVIDLYSIKNSVLGVDFEADGFDFCSGVLDLVVHYKNYFRGIGVDPYFIIVDSNNRPEPSIMECSNYNCDFAIKCTNANYTGVETNIKLLAQISDYIPSMRFIHTDYEVSVALAHLLETGSLPSPTMIISRDMYVSMLPELYGVTWLYPSKFKGNDMSWIANNANVRHMAFTKIYSGNAVDLLYRLPMSVIYSVTKFPSRGYRPLLQYRTVVSKLNENPDAVWSIDKWAELIPGVLNRFKTLDIPVQLESYRLFPESRLIKTPRPKMHDIEGLKLINNNLFAGTLQLDDLLR